MKDLLDGGPRTEDRFIDLSLGSFSSGFEKEVGLAGLVDHKRIALIDDNKPRLLAFSKALETISGVAVRSFQSPKEAFSDIVENNGYDLIVTDVRMDELSGISLVRELRLAGVRHHVVVYSSQLHELSGLKNIKGVTPFYNSCFADCQEADSCDIENGFVTEFVRCIERTLEKVEINNNFANMQMDFVLLRKKFDNVAVDFEEKFNCLKVTMEEVKEGQITKDDLKDLFREYQDFNLEPTEEEASLIKLQRTLSKLYQNTLFRIFLIVAFVAFVLFLSIDESVKKNWIFKKIGLSTPTEKPDSSR